MIVLKYSSLGTLIPKESSLEELWIQGEKDSKSLSVFFEGKTPLQYTCYVIIKRANNSISPQLPMSATGNNGFILLLDEWITEIAGDVTITVKLVKNGSFQMSTIFRKTIIPSNAPEPSNISQTELDAYEKQLLSKLNISEGVIQTETLGLINEFNLNNVYLLTKDFTLVDGALTTNFKKGDIVKASETGIYEFIASFNDFKIELTRVDGEIANIKVDVANNTQEIDNLKNSISDGITIIGTFPSGKTLPTEYQLDEFVLLKTQRTRKNGDLVFFTQIIDNGTDKEFDIYFTYKWEFREHQPIESASNVNKGLIQGTENDTNVNIKHSIIDGKTVGISIKKTNGTYVGVDLLLNAHDTKITENTNKINQNTTDISGNTTKIDANIVNTNKNTQDIISLGNNKANKTEVPEQTSQLINDSGFINRDVTNLTNYMDKQTVEEKISGKKTAYTYDNKVDFLSKSTIEGNRLYVTNSDGFKVATNIGDNIYTIDALEDDYWVAYDNIATTDKMAFLRPLSEKTDLTNYYTKIETDTKINDLEVKKGTHLQIDANGTYNATTNVVSFDIVDVYEFQDNQIVEFDFNLPIVGTIKNDAKFEIVEKSGTKINIITFNGLATFGLLKTIMTYSTETGYRWTMIGDLAYNNAVKSFLPILPSSSVLNLSVDTINLINNGTLRLTTDTYVVPTDSDTTFTKGQMYLWKNNVFELVNPYSTIEEVEILPTPTIENYNKKKLYLNNGKMYVMVKDWVEPTGFDVDVNILQSATGYCFYSLDNGITWKDLHNTKNYTLKNITQIKFEIAGEYRIKGYGGDFNSNNLLLASGVSSVSNNFILTQNSSIEISLGGIN